MTPKPAEKYRSIRVSRRELELLDALAEVRDLAATGGDLGAITRIAEQVIEGQLERGKVGLRPKRLSLKVGSLEIQSGIRAHDCVVTMDGKEPPFRINGLYLQVRRNEAWKILADIMPRPSGWGGGGTDDGGA
jgi:hypothetical protein